MHVHFSGDLGQGGQCPCNECPPKDALKDETLVDAESASHGPPFQDIYEDVDDEETREDDEMDGLKGGRMGRFSQADVDSDDDDDDDDDVVTIQGFGRVRRRQLKQLVQRRLAAGQPVSPELKRAAYGVEKFRGCIRIKDSAGQTIAVIRGQVVALVPGYQATKDAPAPVARDTARDGDSDGGDDDMEEPRSEVPGQMSNPFTNGLEMF